MHSFGSLIDNAINFGLGKKVVDFGSQASAQLAAAHARKRQQTLADPVDAQRFFLLFEKAVEQALSVKKKVTDNDRLVVFLDDLDRCSDEGVFNLLECIKLYLCSRHCVFVFGMDRAHVETAIERAGQYSQREAAHYVEKLFQAQISLPIPDTDAVQGFLALQAQQIETKHFKLSGDDVVLLADLLPANPRLMKNVLNELKFYHQLCYAKKSDQTTFDNTAFILVHLLRTLFPDAYELLFQDGPSVLAALDNVSKGSVDFSNELQAYLHAVMENPIMVSPTTVPGTAAIDSAESSKPMEEVRFRKVRASAWKAKAVDRFLIKFSKQFTHVSDIQGYLI